MIVTVFDSRQFMQRQIMEALLCPINRHCTREQHNCDDWDLWHHPDWLIEHFISHGGAVEFAKRRADFVRVIEIEDNDLPGYEI